MTGIPETPDDPAPAAATTSPVTLGATRRADPGDPDRAPAVLVVDLGGVAGRWLPDRRLLALADLANLGPGAIDGQVFESGFDDAGERGRFDLPTFTAHLAGLLGLPADDATAAALTAAWAAAYEPDPAVLALVAEAACPTALLTNNGPLLEAGLATDLAPVAAAFDHLLFSWRLGVTKPDPAAFAAATEALGVAPADVLFVDDDPANVVAARSFGWSAHQFRDAPTLRAALAARHLVPA